MPPVLHHLRSGDWLTPARISVYAIALLGFEVLAAGFFVAGTHGMIVPLRAPNSTDFVSFYGAGMLADVGTPWLAYDQIAHHAAEQQATAAGIAYNYFYYPPIFLLLCAVLARLPYMVALLGLQAATLGLCWLPVRAILPKVPWFVVLAFPAVFWTLGTGQNAFLTAGLFAAGTVLIERSPFAAGLLLGALCYKPHFGLLIPIALVAGGHWRAIAGAAMSVGTLFGLSLLMFGWATWHAFLVVIAGSPTIYTTHSIDRAGLASPFGAVLVLGGGPSMATGVQVAATLGVALIVFIAWNRQIGLPARAAILLAGTPMAIPVVMFYDLMLVGVAMAWLVRAGQESGFPPWHRTALGLLFLLPLLSGNLDGDSKLLIAPMTAMVGFALASSRVWYELAGRGRRPFVMPADEVRPALGPASTALGPN